MKPIFEARRLAGLGAGATLLALLQLAACSSLLPTTGPTDQTGLSASPWVLASASNQATPGWQHHTFPGKPPSHFRYERKDGREAMAATARSSASMVRQALRIGPAELASVRFSWKVPELMAQADMALRDADDSPVRVVLVVGAA